MNQQEPLKVYLQHRIQSIISKEWWDFVVNVNTMSSDHASLLYSVANLCPSFQNFLKSRDKEIAYILKKRPVIKPRIFSGTERSDVQPTAPPASKENPPQKKSCSSELEKILSELYPNEDIIKRKPRLSGPASKQRKTPLKKFKSAFATDNGNANNPANRADSLTLTSLLRDGDSAASLSTKQPSTSKKHHHSTHHRDRESFSSKENKNVEYAVSDFDFNSNNVSMNLKKVTKVVKVKKKRYFYTDKLRQTPVTYYLADETSDLKFDLIKKYKIKKCSVKINRLTDKQIREATKPKPISLPISDKVDNEKPCKMDIDLKSISLATINEEVDNKKQCKMDTDLTNISHPIINDKVDKRPCKMDKDLKRSESPIIQNPADNKKSLVAAMPSVVSAFLGQEAIQKPAEENYKKGLVTGLPSKTALTVQEDNQKPAKEDNTNRLSPKTSLIEQQETKKSAQEDNKQGLANQLPPKTALAVKQDIQKPALVEDNKHRLSPKMPLLDQLCTKKSTPENTENVLETTLSSKTSSVGQTVGADLKNSQAKPALTVQKVTQMPVLNELEPDTESPKAESMKQSVENSGEDHSNEPDTEPSKNAIIGKQVVHKSVPEGNRKGLISESSSKPSLMGQSSTPVRNSSYHLSNHTSSKTSENEPINKIIDSTSSPKTYMRHSDNTYRPIPKENVDVADKYKPKELNQDLKKVYCHGGIVPLGKKISSVGNTFDKNKHFLSLREKKTKDNPVDLNESVSHLKENEKNSTNSGIMNSFKSKIQDKISVKPTEDSGMPCDKPSSTPRTEENVNKNSDKESDVHDNKSEELDNSDESALVIDESEVNTSTEVIEIGSGEDSESSNENEIPVPMKIKVERMELDESSMIIDSSSSGKKGPMPKSITAIYSNGVDSDNDESIEEPNSKRPRMEVNLAEMKIEITKASPAADNMKDEFTCRLCKKAFSSLGDWLSHFDNNVPKCSPNLQVTWDRPPLQLLN